MTCINKNLKEFKDISKVYGDELAETMVRSYPKNYNNKDIEEFYIPTKKELNNWLNNTRENSKNFFIEAIGINPYMTKEAIISSLKGVIRKKDDSVFIITGWVNAGSLFQKSEALKTVFNLNLKVIKDLALIYPKLFKIVDTRIDYVKKVEITPTEKPKPTQGTLFQNTSPEGQIASEKTIRELAARMSDRIGIPIRFESDRTKQYKGKIENNIAYINLAYATLDTPIHEILGHPIIRAIKNRDKTFFDIIVKKTSAGYQIRYTSKEGIYDMIVNSKIYKTEEEANKEANLLRSQGSPQLYQNLIKELETGKGKEVLDRIKRDYNKKFERGKSFTFEGKDYIADKASSTGYRDKYGDDVNSNELEISLFAYELKHKDKIYYTLEEQQEEAIVELLGLMTAERLDNVKDGKLISLLKRLLKEMKQFVRSLLNQKEVEIDKLPDNMTLGDLSDLLAYSNSKLILPGYEVEYTTPDNMKFKTYQEASNHISELAKSVKDFNLSSIKLKSSEKVKSSAEIKVNSFESVGETFIKYDNKWYYDYDDNYSRPIKEDNIVKIWNWQFDEVTFKQNDEDGQYYIDTIESKGIENFIEKNKEYEQSKEIIEEWKKVNNIQYNPEEIYSRGQEFSSVVGAYSSFDVNLMMQNLLQHIEDNEKAGGKFAISTYTKPIDRVIGHLEGGGGKIKFKIYPKSENILWAANTDVYSGSVWDASLKVNKDKKSELLGVSYTKYPSLQNVNTVQPNLANIVDNLSHHHNELGIVLTGNNFRLEYDEDIPYQTKKIIDSINKILDQKYGKLVKPNIEIKKLNRKESIQFVIDYFNSLNNREYRDFKQDINDAAASYFKLDEPFPTDRQIGEYIIDNIEKYKDTELIRSLGSQYIGIQPTQTNETLKESIDSVKSKVVKYNEGDLTDKSEFTEILEKEYNEAVQKGKKGFDLGTSSFGYTETYDYNGYIYTQIDYNEETGIDTYGKIKKESKEYTSQALINTKIAALKEVAKKYPRSLIRSEVQPTNSQFYKNIGFEDGEMPFQKVPEELNIKPGVQELFDSNPELSSIGTPEQYSQYLDTIFPDSKVKDIVYHSRFNIDNIKNKDRWKNGFYSGTKDQADLMADMAESGSNDLMTTSALLINMQNPKVTTYTDRKVENYKNTNDGFIIEANEKDALQLIGNRDGYNTENFKKEYVVFEPEQIHILGGKQDIEGFKEFVSESTQTVESYRAQEQAELSQRIPNIENYKVNGKVDKSLITDENDLETYNEIYDKYDALITPLLEASEESKEQPEGILKTYEEDLEQGTEDLEDTEDTSNINEDDDFLEEDFPVEEKENKPDVKYTFNEEFELLNRKLISLGLNTLSLEDYDNFTNIQKEIIKSCYGI